MPNRQKSLVDQVVVITGTSAGIGLVTARRAAARGASVVLASRDAASLAVIAAQIEAAGGSALAVVADVTSEADVERIVETARERFGRIDTWVNNAGVAAYSTFAELPIAEHRKIFETNYWGLVHGTLAAVRHFRSRPGAGTVINIGSVNSDIAIPLLSAYSASKHAVKGFNDALRRELLVSDPNIRITLIKPSGIVTGFPQHARNHLESEPRVVPPLYAPEIVADAILDAAAWPQREIVVGAVGPLLSIPLALFPRLMDRILAVAVPPLSRSSNPHTRSDNLDSPTGTREERYRYAPGMPISPYTAAQKHRGAITVALLLVGLTAMATRMSRLRR